MEKINAVADDRESGNQKAAGIFALRLAGFPKVSVYKMHPNTLTKLKRTLRST
jgi:hypothetical protein